MGTRTASLIHGTPDSPPEQESPSAASHWLVYCFDAVHLTNRFFLTFFFTFSFFSPPSEKIFPYLSRSTSSAYYKIPLHLLPSSSLSSLSLYLSVTDIHSIFPFLIVFEVLWDRQQLSVKREGERRYS